MTGAMYAAISGLKSHMNKLNVIGNNIANVNTYGYKAGRVVFEDALYTTSKSGSAGSTTAGSINPSQIGYGVNIGSIDLNMRSGNYTPTGIDSDCFIDGEGFFLLGDKEMGNNFTDSNSLRGLTLSRVGHIDFKADNYLTDGNGNVIYGFMCTGIDPTTKEYTFSDQLVPLRKPKMLNTPATATTPATSTVVYAKEDTTTHRLRDGTAADVNGAGGGGAGGGGTGGADTDTELPFAVLDSITIDKATGLITGVTKDTSQPVVIGFIAMANVANPGGLTHLSGPYFRMDDSAGELSISLMGGAAEEAGLQYIQMPGVDPANNQNPDAAQDEGLRIGNAGNTKLITGGLESSGTDLATEIAEMITTQRGYQANTRIITVTDSMLEELVNIKR